MDNSRSHSLKWAPWSSQSTFWSPSDQDLLLISRNESRLWSPHVVDGGRAHPYKINLEAEQQVCAGVWETWKPFCFTCLDNDITSFLHLQEYKPIGTTHNRKAQPFVAAANIDDKRQVVSASYNTPIGLYSSGNIQDAMEGQIRGLVHQKPARWCFPLCLQLKHGSRFSHSSAATNSMWVLIIELALVMLAVAICPDRWRFAVQSICCSLGLRNSSRLCIRFGPAPTSITASHATHLDKNNISPCTVITSFWAKHWKSLTVFESVGPIHKFFTLLLIHTCAQGSSSQTYEPKYVEAWSEVI